jgi:hypothetical protein
MNIIALLALLSHNKARHQRALRALDLQTATRFIGRCWQRYVPSP